MSFYEDYVAEGSHCMCCGVFIGGDCGYPRECADCAKPESPDLTPTQRRNARKRRAKARCQGVQP